MTTPTCATREPLSRARRLFSILIGGLALLLPAASHTADTVCAQVKIEIKQELTLERQGFDAMMRITNGLDTTSLDNVDITVSFADEAGNVIKATSDPNDTTASFFIRIDTMDGVNNVTGTGTVAPASTAEIHWLIIPAPGAGGTVPTGKLYYVGATLKYSVGGKAEQVTVTPDFIYVKPMPLLTLDYFLTQDVWGDDPLTAAVEPIEPYTLGVRIKNTGAATAKNVKIDSAQPKIVENEQGLAINFQIVGSYLNDQPATQSLLIPFGDIAASSAANGRWLMTSTLAGRFVEFNATFTHADELGGAVTSLLQATNAHFLIRDVKVDLPGRDNIRDFLGSDGGVVRLYESSGLDTAVADQSAYSVLTAAGTNTAGEALYSLTTPATAGAMYVRLPDPYNGTKALGKVTRADGKLMASENVWLSKKRENNVLKHYFNLFDTNTSGIYNVAIVDPSATPRPPVIQFIPDKTVTEGTQVSFLVESSDPDGTAPVVTASNLPNGATFTAQTGSNNLVTGIFDWTPAQGQSGKYPITFIASDGALTTSATTVITVGTPIPPAGPDTPIIAAPQVGTEVAVLEPELMVNASANALDTATSYHFQVYADAGFQQLVAEKLNVARGLSTTFWKLPVALADNTHYYWRVRASDGTTYSPWAVGRFFVNTANDAPSAPTLATPSNGTTVAATGPTLSITNSVDPEGETVVYGFEVYTDSTLSQKVAEVADLPAGANGETSWTVAPALTDTTLYYWRATAADSHGARTASAVGNFLVDTTKPAPGAPALLAPVAGSTVTTANVDLTVTNSVRPSGMTVSYFFELDRDPGFTSSDIMRSGPRPEGSGQTSFTVTGLAENARYYWRARVSDGLTDSPWTYGEFFVDTRNDAPTIPAALNPGDNAWVTTLRPLMEIGPSTDPEGDAVAYRIEIYSDATLATLVADRLTNNLSWLLDVALTDDARYYWRVRAEDLRGGASDWSPVSTFYVRTGSSSPMTPTATLTSPADVVTVTGPTVTLAWEIDDPEHNSHVSLFYDSDAQGADGTRIVDGLPQDATTRTGSYSWDVSALSPGTYYVYAVVSNSAGSATRYAPGAFVVPVPNPRGVVTVNPVTSPLETSEAGGQASFTVVLASSPKSDVTVGLSVTHPGEATLDKPQLVFNTSNWKTPQTVTLTGLPDCVNDGDVAYQMITAKSESADPDYQGIKGADLSLVNRHSIAGCPTNNLPLANAGPDQLVESGAAVVLTGSGTDSDGAIASYAWLQTAGPTVALTDAASAISGFTAPVLKNDTVLSFQLTTTDNEGASSTDTVNVTVKAAPNQPPVANAGQAQTVVMGATVNLTGTGTDADGTVATYAWTQIAGPQVTINGVNTANASFVAPAVTANTIFGFQLTVTDNLGATGTATVAITVIPNVPPVVSAGTAQTVNEGAVVTLAGSATDSDGNIASYLWTQTAGPAVTLVNANTAGASFVAPWVTADTVLTFQLTATDNLGSSGSASVSVTVKNVPSAPPVADAGGAYATTAGRVLTFNGSGSSDPEGAALTYQWNFGDGSTGTGVRPTHTYSSAGTYTVTLIVSDGEQSSAPDTATVLVLPMVSGTVTAGILPTSVTIPPNTVQGMVLAATNQTGVTLQSLTMEYSYSAGLLVADPITSPKASYAKVDSKTRRIKITWTNVADGQSMGGMVGVAGLFAGTYTLSPVSVSYVLPDGTTRTVTGNSATVKVSSTGNKAPSVSAGAAQTVNEGTLVQLQASATDSDGTIVAYYWQQLSGPAVTLSNPLSKRPTFTAPAVSADTVLGFAVYAADNNYALGYSTTTVTVKNVP